MSIADLMQKMADAGAPMEAILVAVRAIEEKDSQLSQEQARAEEKREADRNRKRRQREKGRAGHAHVTGQSRDKVRTVTGQPLSLDKERSPTPPKEINPYPGNTPLTPHGGPIWLDLRICEIVLEVIASGCAALTANTLTPEHVIEAWNDIAEQCGLPKAKMNDRRRKALKARIRQFSIEDFTEAIACIQRNPWMHGDNDRGWRADFDFFLQPKSFNRLIEGSYDRTQSH